MRIFLAGGTGAVGQRLVPLLTAAGHEVTATSRSESKFAALTAAGATPVALDALDRDAVIEAVVASKAEVVVHQLTALSGSMSMKKFDETFAVTNRLRTEGIDNLLEAARLAGARRFVGQSYTGWNNARTGSWVKTEDDPLDLNPTSASRQSMAAIKHLEKAVMSADLDGVALRFGNFYGPGNTVGRGGEVLNMVKSRKMPVVAGGAGVWSFIHVDDVAAATKLAIESDVTGIFNIVDDEPAPVSVWLPYLAEAIGAKPPMRMPGWLARPMLGEHGLSMMTKVRGASNAKAKRELGFTLKYPTWREGFRTGL